MKKLFYVMSAVALSVGMAFAGEESRINPDCLNYMAAKGITWQNAVTYCRGGTRVECLDLEIDYWTANGRADTAFNNAVSYCHSQARRDCVEAVAALSINILINNFNSTLPPNDPNRRAAMDPASTIVPSALATADSKLFSALQQVWNNSEQACRLNQTASCVLYVYNHYNPNDAGAQSAQNAINFAQNQCGNGTRAGCIQQLVDRYKVDWESAVNQCRN